MTSLRARLVAAVLAIAAVGLVALAAIVYFEQRSFLLDRADEQAREGAGAVAGALAQRGIGEHDEPDRDRPGRPPRAGGPGVGLPAGTYGELRTGGKTYPVVFDYGQNVDASPKIPEQAHRRQAADRLRQGQRRQPLSHGRHLPPAMAGWRSSPCRSPTRTRRSTGSCSSRGS